MSSIFDNYENISSQYIPSNMNKKHKVPTNNPFLEHIGPKRPYEIINAEGELVGYWWAYGDTVDLDFELTGIVTIDGSDKYIDVEQFIKDKQIKIEIFDFRHENIHTVIYEGNNFIAQSYKPVTVDSRTIGYYYVYENDKYEIVKLPDSYQQGITYYEKEPIHVILPINLTLSQEMVKGTYYCSLSIISKTLSATIFFEDSCTLEVR